MSGRRLSKQQRKRIQAAQQASSDSDAHRSGLVVSHQGGVVLVELESTEVVECHFRANLGNIVCGDRVSIEATAQGRYRVAAIRERDNLLQRLDGFGQARAVAANISQLVVCLAHLPRPNLFLLDQYLLSAEQQNIEACILINKSDLGDPGCDPYGIESTYAPLGYKVLRTSIKSGEGMKQFSRLLQNQVSVLGGVSGVGKSSLTSWLLPGEEIRIAALSDTNEEGRHTTRASRLYHLPCGGDLIDTPGVRGFGPYIDDGRPLAAGFREIDRHGEHCRFHNCLHRNEPDCAVLEALRTGEIAEGRYQSYLKLLN